MRSAARWIAAITVALSACVSPTDPFERARALEQAQHKYAEGLRWGNLEKSAKYVDPQMRNDFLALAGRFDSVRITDYDIGEVDLDEDTLAQAEVDVTYRGYVLPQYLEKRMHEHQVWYRDKESGNEWRVRPELAAMLDDIGARH
jgi:hypothetical protein